MEGKSDMNKMDEVILPGFRFHPTDEELVGFYLRRKIQNRTLPMELIKQVDIYKYDPWDLPKLACSGEKEWYFYCPRDRKYRNSTRPNRVTVAGFWKATGTDRPIYASSGPECIGLKKSLVFYRGKAAKGIKTNWMMHEFRLPSSATSTPPPENVSDKTLLPNDSWAICRIFKKTNTIAPRALSRSWVSQTHDAGSSDHILIQGAPYNLFSPVPTSSKTETGSPVHLSADNPSFSALEVPVYKPILDPTCLKSHPFPFSTEYLSPVEMPKSTIDAASMPFNISPALINTDIGKILESVNFQEQQQSSNLGVEYSNDEWGNTELKGFPFGLSSNVLDTWKTDYIWDLSPVPSDMPNTFSTNETI